MTPDDYGREAATKFNANNPGHFPGRPLFEGLVADAIRAAVAAERERCAKVAEKFAAEKGAAYKHGRTPDRADPHVQGMSCGAEAVAELIREGK